METTYYTPGIREFHVGFEFEYKNQNGDWISSEIDEDWATPPIIGDIHNRRIRVRCLCREDIESLGWVYDPKESSTSWDSFLWPKASLDAYDPKALTLFDRGMVSIDNGLDGECREAMFRGDIKSKSALKTLMQQIGML